jgi:hypothetical protein
MGCGRPSWQHGKQDKNYPDTDGGKSSKATYDIVIFVSSFPIRINLLQRFILQMHNDFETLVASSGLRYTIKESGSPFVGMGSSGATLSCIKCGNHKLRTRGAFRRYPSGLMFFCFDCKPKANHPCDASVSHTA